MKKQGSSFTSRLVGCVLGQSLSASFLFVTFLCSILPQVVHAQAPPCPSASSVNFTFAPTAQGDSHTETINLAPCETIEVHESHDMGGDPNRGATLAVSFLNSAQQEIVGQGISGFLSATDNRFPALYEEPFPLNGVRDPNALPATFKVWAIDGVGYGTPPIQPQYNFTIIRSPRPGYNIGGYDFATAPLVPSFPASYMGSLRALDPPAPKPSDRGQYLKVHLQCGQSISVSGFAHENTLYGANFAVDLYGANQQLVIPKPWVGITVSSYGTTTYQSSTFVNPNSAASDFYIRVYCDYENVQDFTINIASNEVDNPRPVAPDATGGSTTNSEEYRLPASIDTDVLTGRNTELWAKVYWPPDFSGGPYPLVLFLHGNHYTCGRALTSPRVDDDNSYTYSGTCGSSPFSINGTVGTARNDTAGWFGMKITTGPQAIVVRSLGRIFITNNTGTHTIRIIRASDNVQMGSVSLSMLGGDNNQMKYQPLASPATLAGNTSYYIVSLESIGGDQWYDSNSTIIGTGAAIVNGSASSPDGTTWSVGNTSGQTYGLVDFVYDFTNAPGYSVVQNHLGYEYLATQLASRGYIVASINANLGITVIGNDAVSYPDDPLHIFSRGRLVLKHLETLSKWNGGGQALITPTTFGSLRRNSNNWFGMKITVGSHPITVYALARIFVSGNTGTHAVKIVRASDGTDVPNGSVVVPMTGGTSGVFKYVNLATPVTLAANSSYYIASKELKNGDYWYDSNTTVTSTSIATVNGRVTSTNGATWDASGAVPGNVYVPVNFKYQVLSVNLTGKIDFTNVGLMGHSRGGQGVLAAYNLYRTSSIDPRPSPTPDIVWSTRIPAMNIKAIFEIGPTDFFLPTSSDGGSQYLNADGSAFNVLLPMCDGDVSNLAGIRVFDRMMAFTGNNIGIPADNPATQKSTYSVWGANHNFFNTEWQQTESRGCKGPNNNRLFPIPVTDGSGSPNQRTTGSASLLAFFRANVGASASPTFNQNFSPRYDHPGVITSIIMPSVRIDRGFTPSPNSAITKVLFDFPAALPTHSSYEYTDPNVAFTNAVPIPEHDYVTNPTPCYEGINPPPCPQPSPIALVLKVGNVTWETASCSNYFQVDWTDNTGDNINGYQTLDFRVSRQIDVIRNSSASTNFQIQFIAANGSPTGVALSLNKYLDLTGPVGLDDGTPDGFLHPILQTVRIPLSDFTGANLSNVRGVRFVFSDTPKGAIYLANIRLSNQP